MAAGRSTARRCSERETPGRTKTRYETTEHWPQSWTRPLDVPSGVGNVTSAAYCMPIGRAPTTKKPSAAKLA